ncbi:hypothetical protein, partial [Vibrio mediterranei]|uniref:hypothetical protein n=1 Tax=Vibrio mediterranei TaxID=689 RepID=UPI001695AF8B|nr:hypothetical protein [Vibrio mediterranei]
MKIRHWVSSASLLLATQAFAENTIDLSVTVESASEPIYQSDVQLWKAEPNKKPTIMAESHSSKDGKVHFSGLPQLEGGYYYIVAEGGVRNGDSIKEYKAMAAL